MPTQTRLVPGIFTHRAGFGIFANRAFTNGLACLLVAVFIFFALVPDADIAVSRLFYEAGACGNIMRCGGFPRAKEPAYVAARLILYAMPYAVLCGILLINTVVFTWHKISFTRDLPVVAALVGSMLLGPLFMVNMVLKDFVLRTRPREVTFFGGKLPFVPVGQWHGMCIENCSFVSGEAALAPIMMLSVLLFPKVWQKPAFLILLPTSIAMAVLRLMVGAHYISDVILGYGLTVLIFCFLARFFESRRTKSLTV